jgi:hypothetical protein
MGVIFLGWGEKKDSGQLNRGQKKMPGGELSGVKKRELSNGD